MKASKLTRVLVTMAMSAPAVLVIIHGIIVKLTA